MIQESLPVKNYYDIARIACYDPATEGYCTGDWQGTAYDVLRADKVPAKDRIWAVVEAAMLPEEFEADFTAWAFNWICELDPTYAKDDLWKRNGYSTCVVVAHKVAKINDEGFYICSAWQEMVDWLVNEIEQRNMPVADKRED